MKRQQTSKGNQKKKLIYIVNIKNFPQIVSSVLPFDNDYYFTKLFLRAPIYTNTIKLKSLFDWTR